MSKPAPTDAEALRAIRLAKWVLGRASNDSNDELVVLARYIIQVALSRHVVDQIEVCKQAKSAARAEAIDELRQGENKLGAMPQVTKGKSSEERTALYDYLDETLRSPRLRALLHDPECREVLRIADDVVQESRASARAQAIEEAARKAASVGFPDVGDDIRALLKSPSPES